jgi:Hydrogenase maturation factor
MINLLITSDGTAWTKSPAFLEPERCLTEYILPELKEKYSTLSPRAINELKTIPCLFTYEKFHKSEGYVGFIKNIDIYQKGIKIDYELTGQVITFDNLMQLTELLDMGTWEWNRTHWTIKKTKLEELKPYLQGNYINKPKIFISYSWNPPSNQQNVFSLINKLEKDGINVVYDRKDLHPGQDMNYFMEHFLTSDEIDSIIIVCNEDYAEKANKRMGGVGYESEMIISEIKNEPLQRKYIPVIFEHGDNGELPLPNFLKSRYCVDLSRDEGYDDLLNAIKRLKEEFSA